MDQKNSSCVNSVRFRFYGYTFDLPADHDLHSVEIGDKSYTAHTSKGDHVLKACLKCKQLLTYEKFYDGRSPCKQCHIRLVKGWRKSHPDLEKLYKSRSNKRYRYKQKLISAGLL